MPYYDEYTQYQSFASIDELNDTSYAYLDQFSDQLTNSTIDIFKRITRYSCVVIGVSWLKVRTLASILDKSEKTVRRALKQLETLHIIRRVPTIRSQGGRGYDIVVIQPMSTRDQSKIPHDIAPNKPFETLETTKSNNLLNKRSTEKHADSSTRENATELDHAFVSERVPEVFVKAVKPFFDNARVIESFWYRSNIAAWKNTVDDEDETKLNVALSSFRQTIRGLKFGRVRDKFAYFYRIAYRKFNAEYERELDEIAEREGLTFNFDNLPAWIK
jgi:hypothetical protein